MPPDSYVDWGAVHFYTPLNRTDEQILTDEEKVKGCAAVNTAVVPKEKDTWYSTDPIRIIVTLPVG